MSATPKPTSSFLDEWLAKRRVSPVPGGAIQSPAPVAAPAPSAPATIAKPVLDPRVEVPVTAEPQPPAGELRINRNGDKTPNSGDVIHIDKDGNLSIGNS
jgi:hypothetical protein